MFTIPALAQVGLTEAEARQQGLDGSAVSRAPFEDSAAAAMRDETEGLVKVVFEESTGRLLGVHILGPAPRTSSTSRPSPCAAASPAKDLAGMHYVYPTLAGSVFDAMWD